MRNKFLGTGEPGYHPLRKIRVVSSGLRYAAVYDLSVAYKIVLSAAVLGLAFAFREVVDVLVILVATGLVLVAELLNSAIEAVCDFVEARDNWKIGVIKDIAAAGAGVAIAV
jgi:diacylglycerol kinase (ATP)